MENHIRKYRQMRREKKQKEEKMARKEPFFPFGISIIRGGYFGTITKSYFSLGEALHDI